MTTTEEIVVSGEELIARRIFVYAQEAEIHSLQQCAYKNGYNRGWTRGFLAGLGVIGLAILCIWLLPQL